MRDHHGRNRRALPLINARPNIHHAHSTITRSSEYKDKQGPLDLPFFKSLCFCFDEEQSKQRYGNFCIAIFSLSAVVPSLNRSNEDQIVRRHKPLNPPLRARTWDPNFSPSIQERTYRYLALIAFGCLKWVSLITQLAFPVLFLVMFVVLPYCY